MAITETLSVRLSPRTRQVLADAAPKYHASGASALARDILERWAEEVLASETRDSVSRAVSYLRAHPQGWADDPAEFFRNDNSK